ncbi:unnamed protein product [Phytophthora fragariaefolia]|uniref:Unnamed protein product n=1 Tax=Phytophthora fragariaefolia TaxID=1490495 RepID=A0A9W6YC10_9STRA|nr:unnamed protein product [Phytophthora fragariaefolia]
MASRAGRPPSEEAEHFKLLKELGSAPGGYSYRECKFCRAAYDSDVTPTTPKVVIGRRRNYVSHLARCTHYQAAQLPQKAPRDPSLPTEAAAATQEASPAFSLDRSSIDTPESVVTRTATSRSQSMNKSRARRTLVLDKGSVLIAKRRKLTPALKTQDRRRQFTKHEVEEIERLLVEIFAENHLSARFIEQDSVLRFLELLCPGVTDILPSRHTLRSRILQEHAAP